jgi:hypothetical protein
MDNLSAKALNSGHIAEASIRLSRALEALEARMKTLKAQAQSLNKGLPLADHHKLLAEIEEIHLREKMLELAAHNAFEALGAAAANIRHIVQSEAA